MTSANKNLANGRLDVALREVLKSAAMYRLPVEFCFFLLFGIQLSLTLFLPIREFFWLPLLCVVVVAAWFQLGLKHFTKAWPCGMSVARAWETFGFPTSSPILKRLRLLAWAAMIGLAIPGWVGLVAWATIFSVLVFFPFKGRETLPVLTKIYAISGLVVILTTFLGTQLPWLANALFALTIFGVFAFGFTTILALAQRFKDYGQDAAMSVGILLPVPLLATDKSFSTVLIFAAVGLIAIPVALHFVAWWRVQTLLSNCRKLLEDKNLRECLTSELQLKTAEDTVRESDGYYRVCSPPYSSATESRVGEGGYISWIGSSVFPSGDCVVIRSSSVANHTLTAFPDKVGLKMHSFVTSLIPTLGNSKFEIIQRELTQMWGARILSPRDEMLLLKMPWDHPELIVVPFSWEGKWTYPAGSGLFDSQGYPCFADYADVRIVLKESVREAIHNYGASQHPASNPVLLQFINNHTRILPGCYETLLHLLIISLRKCSVPLLFEHDDWESQKTAQQQRLLDELNRDLEKALPAPLAELITFKIVDLSFDTYVVEKRRRENIEQLRSLKQKMRSTQVTSYRGIRAEVLRYLFLSDSSVSSWRLIQRLNDFHSDVRAAAHNARSDLESALGQGNTTENSSVRLSQDHVPPALDATAKEHDAFQNALDSKEEEMRTALLNIQRALSGTGRT